MEQVVLDRMNAAGFKLAGGMWGEAFWKVLGPSLIASIAADEDGCTPPASDRDRCCLLLYVPADKEEERFFADFAAELITSFNADAPSAETFVVVQNIALLEALRLATRFEAAFKMKGGDAA